MAGTVGLTLLKNELINDPHGYGYSPYIDVDDMQSCANILNEQRLDQFTSRELYLRELIMSNWNLAEVEASYNHADGTGQARLRLACFTAETDHPIGVIPLGFVNPAYQVYDHIARAFQNAGNVSYNAMNAASQRTASHAESLWGAGTIVTWQDCYNALQLP